MRSAQHTSGESAASSSPPKKWSLSGVGAASPSPSEWRLNPPDIRALQPGDPPLHFLLSSSLTANETAEKLKKQVAIFTGMVEATIAKLPAEKGKITIMLADSLQRESIAAEFWLTQNREPTEEELSREIKARTDRWLEVNQNAITELKRVYGEENVATIFWNEFWPDEYRSIFAAYFSSLRSVTSPESTTFPDGTPGFMHEAAIYVANKFCKKNGFAHSVTSLVGKFKSQLYRDLGLNDPNTTTPPPTPEAIGAAGRHLRNYALEECAVYKIMHNRQTYDYELYEKDRPYPMRLVRKDCSPTVPTMIPKSLIPPAKSETEKKEITFNPSDGAPANAVASRPSAVAAASGEAEKIEVTTDNAPKLGVPTLTTAKSDSSIESETSTGDEQSPRGVKKVGTPAPTNEDETGSPPPQEALDASDLQQKDEETNSPPAKENGHASGEDGVLPRTLCGSKQKITFQADPQPLVRFGSYVEMYFPSSDWALAFLTGVGAAIVSDGCSASVGGPAVFFKQERRLTPPKKHRSMTQPITHPTVPPTAVQAPSAS